MRNTLIFIVAMFFCFTLVLLFNGTDADVQYKRRFNYALDNGTAAAVKKISYSTKEQLEAFQYGFGEGLEDKLNISIDKDQALKYFYLVFYRNFKIEDNPIAQEYLNQYLHLKCLVTYDKIAIADVYDDWKVEKQFIIPYNGKDYLFTLSDQLMDLETNTWVRDYDIGLDGEERKELLVAFIEDEVNDFLNSRENTESGGYYRVHLGLNDYDPELSTVNGVNFFVFTEGIPIPATNIFSPKQKFYSFSFGGSELYRK